MFAGCIHGNPGHVFPVTVKAALDGQCVVVEAQYHVPLGVEQVGAGRGTGLKGKLILAGSRGLELHVV